MTDEQTTEIVESVLQSDILTDPKHFRADCQLIGRSVRRGWITEPEKRAEILHRLISAVSQGCPDNMERSQWQRQAASAFSALVAADDANALQTAGERWPIPVSAKRDMIATLTAIITDGPNADLPLKTWQRNAVRAFDVLMRADRDNVAALQPQGAPMSPTQVNVNVDTGKLDDLNARIANMTPRAAMGTPDEREA